MTTAELGVLGWVTQARDSLMSLLSAAGAGGAGGSAPRVGVGGCVDVHVCLLKSPGAMVR